MPQECPERPCHKRAPQDCRFHKRSHKSVPRESPTRVSRKSVPQECRTRVPRTVVHKSVLHKSPPKECCMKVSPKSVQQCLAVCFRVRVCIRVRGSHLVIFLNGLVCHAIPLNNTAVCHFPVPHRIENSQTKSSLKICGLDTSTNYRMSREKMSAAC